MLRRLALFITPAATSTTSLSFARVPTKRLHSGLQNDNLVELTLTESGRTPEIAFSFDQQAKTLTARRASQPKLQAVVETQNHYNLD